MNVKLEIHLFGLNISNLHGPGHSRPGAEEEEPRDEEDGKGKVDPGEWQSLRV